MTNHYFTPLLTAAVGLIIGTHGGTFTSASTASPVTAVSLPTAVKMTVMGDIMLDRYVRQSIVSKGKTYPFEKIKNEFLGQDIVLANLEGNFTGRRSVATVSHLIFTFDPAMAPVLQKVGITTVSLANNHSLNFGQTGLDNTRKVLRSAKIDSFGDPNNRTGFTVIKTINERRIGFVGYHGLYKSVDSVLTEVKNLRPKVDTLIVMPHAGVEYKLTFTKKQQSDYRRLIDAGADLVLAAHPHVVEPFEIYKNKLIAYSLGNFLFDQYFSNETLMGMMLKLNISSPTTTVHLVPIITENKQIHILTGPRRQALLNRLAKDSLGTAAQKESIRMGGLTLP